MAETVAQTDKRKERILNHAEKIFFADGFHKVPLDELVGELRISKSTIYDYFGSKEGLVAAVVDRLDDRLDEHLETHIRDASVSVPQRVLQIAHFQGETARNLSHRFVKQLQVHTPEVWEEHQRRRLARIDKYYRPLINEGVDNGDFDPSYDSEFILQMYLNMSMIITLTDILDHVPYSRTVAYRNLIRVFFHGTGAKNYTP